MCFRIYVMPGCSIFTYPACNLQYLVPEDVRLYSQKGPKANARWYVLWKPRCVRQAPRTRCAAVPKKNHGDSVFLGRRRFTWFRCRSFAQFLRRGRWHILDILVTSKYLVPDFSPLVAMARYPLLYRAAAPGGAGAQVKPHCATSPCWYNYGKGSRVTQIALFQAGTCLQTQPDMCFLAWTFSAYWPLCSSLSINQWSGEFHNPVTHRWSNDGTNFGIQEIGDIAKFEHFFLVISYYICMWLRAYTQATVHLNLVASWGDRRFSWPWQLWKCDPALFFWLRSGECDVSTFDENLNQKGEGAGGPSDDWRRVGWVAQHWANGPWLRSDTPKIEM